MSPEQVRGDQVDHRSDIFAFGLILYEMLAGKRAFWRNNQVETLHAILDDEPQDLLEVNKSCPPGSPASSGTAWRRTRSSGSSRRATWRSPSTTRSPPCPARR